MKKYLVILLLAITTIGAKAQTRGVKVGYIDMEYILQNVPDYTEAKNQLEQKAQKWKLEIETKKTEINKLKDALINEKPLLTKELIEEREDEIKFQEKEMLDYQQKRFGPSGDLTVQKATLVKPIQDQVFTITQDLAETRKYDFIFDKSSDMTMLFAAKRFDLSDQVVRVLVRSNKRVELSKKQLKAQEEKDRIDDYKREHEGEPVSEREKTQQATKAARQKAIDDRKQIQEERIKTNAAARQKAIDDKNAKKNGTVSASTDKTGKTNVNTEDKKAKDEAIQKAADAKTQIINDRKKSLEERKKIIEDKKIKALQLRENAKKTRDSIQAAKINNK